MSCAILIKSALIALGLTLLTGCATTSLMNDSKQNITKVELVADKVVAFARPASTANLPNDSVVIVGQTNSYVLTEGGTQLVALLSTLEPKNITVNNQLAFYSANNDGRFAGKIELSYARLKQDLQYQDLQFLLQNKASECSNASDTRMNAQRFCFQIAVQGEVYPQVSNFDLLRSKFTPLTRPYSVSIYTQASSRADGKAGALAAGKLLLLPLAVAFDVVTLPVQALAALQ